MFLMRYLKEFYRFLKHVLESRELLFTLSNTDFKEQYLGSYLGIFWAVLRPALFIAVIWFIFGIGFKSKPVNDGTPFILWLLCGFIPWFFFAEAVNKSMNAIVSNAFLVKKVAFRVSILPLVKILSTLYIHIVFVGILLFIFILYGYYPTIYWIQIPYFIVCTIVLTLGLGWLTSSLKVFIKDIGEIIGLIIQFGFWLTPIFWSINIIPEKYHSIIKLNPMFYIIEGFRNTLIHQTWVWESSDLTIYFIGITMVIFVSGAIMFKRLRPHFGDVL
ncbi:MAG: ABC transporter permease [gamma proteobacterium symbiont of Lucinoma myriamae]|nr:ABC transporter permease [gamma proteobacterium symbiont of Lucinoma myriamae]MCU7819173.1 ABC transporter permease [gamma proteobacterium symbiont of Lucinoma myriamae]